MQNPFHPDCDERCRVPHPVLEDVPGKVVLLGVAGSHAFGLAHAESDVDYRGCYVAPTRDLFRLTPPAESFTHTKPDVALHEVGKLLRHAASANPTALETLHYVDYVACDPTGEFLLANRHRFVTDKIRATHLGFAKSQFEKLKKRYQPWGDERRWRKHARHTVRVVRLTERVLTTGEYTLRDPDPEALFAFSQLGVDEMVFRIENEITRIEGLPTHLPPGPDLEAVDNMLFAIRDRHIDG